MPLARTNIRGWRLKSRLGVNGIQWRSSFSSVISMAVSVVSAECGSDLRRGRAQARHELNGAHQRQTRRRRLYGNRGDYIIVPVAHWNCNAGDTEYVLLVVDGITDAHDPIELGLEYGPLGDGALGEPLQWHQLEQPLALGGGKVRQQQLAACTAVQRQHHTSLRQMQAQRPGRLDTVEID